MADEQIRVTITLTNRRPVRVDPAEWPTTARADFDRESSDMVERGSLAVRQHRDGRAIVIGLYQLFSTLRSDVDVKAGELVIPSFTGNHDSEIIAAIHRVHRTISERIGTSIDRWDPLADECIASFEPEDL